MTYSDNNIFIIGDASNKVFQELKNNGLSVNKAKKAWIYMMRQVLNH